MNLYPSSTLVLLVFNLLGWWFKGQPFFSFWWFVLIFASDIVLQALTLAITKQMMKSK